MELRHLRYFLAIAENNSYRQASEELLISQPTLSQQMKDLEKELGVALFERAGRGIRLTQQGKLFVDYAQRSLNVLSEAQSAINEFAAVLRGRLRIGVLQTVGAYLIPSAAVRFSTEFPGVDLQLLEMSAGEIEDSVCDGSIDLGISFQPAGRREIEFEKLFEEQLMLFVCKSHTLSSRKTINCASIAPHRLCLLGKQYSTRRIIDSAFAEVNATPDTAVEVNSVTACLNVAESGGPATILPALAGCLTKAIGISIRQPVIKRTVGLLTATYQSPIRAQEKFIKVIKEIASEKLK